MNITNLTPHEITFIDNNLKIIQTIPQSGKVARCSVERKQAESIGSIPVNETVFGEVEGLPEEKDGHIYIVSSLVAQACPERDDLYIPDETVRTNDGKILGCKALTKI